METLGEGEEAGVGLRSVLCENGTDLDLGIVFDLRWLHRNKGWKISNDAKIRLCSRRKKAYVSEATIEWPYRFLGGCGSVLV